MTDALNSLFHPELEGLTENERAWVGFLRLIAQDTDPAPTLARVQALRSVFSNCRSSHKATDWGVAD